MISGVREKEIVRIAWECVQDCGFSALPVKPGLIATSADISVVPWKPTKLGISGFLMRVGDKFGIGYSAAIENDGFINFTIAHELGHYFLDGHPEALFASGSQYHYSESGFVSDNVLEREADVFAAELLMPEAFFKNALRESGTGLTGILRLAELGCTSLVATAIRFAKMADEPVAVILSSGAQVDWCFISKALRECRGVYNLGKRSFRPPQSATAKFNRDAGKIERGENVEDFCSLSQWFERAPDVEFQEDVVGLGHYGKTLTVLFTEEALSDEDEDDEEDDDAETGLPSSRWRSRDETRRDD